MTELSNKIGAAAGRAKARLRLFSISEKQFIAEHLNLTIKTVDRRFADDQWTYPQILDLVFHLGDEQFTQYIHSRIDRQKGDF